MEKTQNTRIKNTNISSEWKLQPRCMVGTRSPAYVNTGHISPCCWVDGISTQKEDGYKALFTNDMKLENLNRVEEVFSSEAWIDFFLMLKTDPQSAPNICWKHCGDFTGDPNSKTPMRDQVKTEEYNQLKKKYDINYARNRCVDGLSARLTKKDDL